MNTCKGKKIYSSEHVAKRVRTAIYNTRPRHLRVYKCRVCFGWHLTKNEKFI